MILPPDTPCRVLPVTCGLFYTLLEPAWIYIAPPQFGRWRGFCLYVSERWPDANFAAKHEGSRVGMSLTLCTAERCTIRDLCARAKVDYTGTLPMIEYADFSKEPRGPMNECAYFVRWQDRSKAP